MAAADATTVAREELDLVCLEARGGTLGLEVSRIREVVRDQPVTPLPDAPPLVEGVLDLRGRMLPVVDLGRVLDGEPVEVGPAARIVVLEVDELLLGLRVESVTEVARVDARAAEPPPELASGSGNEAVSAVVRRIGSPPVMVLSLQHLLRRVRGAPGADASHAAPRESGSPT